MKINDKVTIIDYDECELYYFDEDTNRDKFKLHYYIDKDDWNECQATNSLTISKDGSFEDIDSFGLYWDVCESAYYRLWFYKKFVRSTDISNLKVGDFIRVKPFSEVKYPMALREFDWKILYSKPLKIRKITARGNYLIQYSYDDESDLKEYYIDSSSIRYVCTEEEVDTFVAKYGTEKKLVKILLNVVKEL